MQYIIGGLILIFIIKLVLDLFGDYRLRPGKQSGKNKVIDISDRWINVDSLPYRRRGDFLRQDELDFFSELEKMLQDSVYRVLPHIPLADIVSVPSTTHNRSEYLQRAREQSLDLVIFELPEYQARLIILLEEDSLSKKQQLSDMFTEKALGAAGYAFMKVNLNQAPDRQKVLHSLQKLGISV